MMNDKQLIERIISNTQAKIAAGDGVTYINRSGRCMTKAEVENAKKRESAFANDLRNVIKFTSMLSGATGAAAHLLRMNIDKIRSVPNCETGVIDYLVTPMSMHDLKPYLYDTPMNFVVDGVPTALDGYELFMPLVRKDDMSGYEKGLLTKVKKQAWRIRKEFINRKEMNLTPNVKRLLQAV